MRSADEEFHFRRYGGVLSQAQAEGGACEPLPGRDELTALFPDWKIEDALYGSHRSVAYRIHSEREHLNAYLTMRRGRKAAVWTGAKPPLEHPHIVPILEWGVSGDMRYLIFTRPGESTLAEALQAGLVSRKALVRDLQPAIASAVAASSEFGIELDTRPEAILYDCNGIVRLCPLLSDEPEPGGDSEDHETGDMCPRIVIDRYVLVDLLGEGGFAEVYLAEQREPIKRQVALKILKQGMDSEEVLARFEAEGQALARLNHPAIATIFDAGTTPEGRPYFVMEYVPGKTLTQYTHDAGLELNAKLALFREICLAVDHAHRQGIVHRDLKPANILIEAKEAGGVFPKIIDFGIAKATEQPLTERTLHTRFYQLMGSLNYMSPEQASMLRNVDGRTDIYALGCILYELVTGTTPLGPRGRDMAPLDALAFSQCVQCTVWRQAGNGSLSASSTFWS